MLPYHAKLFLLFTQVESSDSSVRKTGESCVFVPVREVNLISVKWYCTPGKWHVGLAGRTCQSYMPYCTAPSALPPPSGTIFCMSLYAVWCMMHDACAMSTIVLPYWIIGLHRNEIATQMPCCPVRIHSSSPTT